MSLLDIVKNVGVIASATMGVLALLTTIVKPIRVRVSHCIKKVANVESVNKEIKGLKDELEERNNVLTEAINLLREENAKQTEALTKLNDDIKTANLANKASLGNSIKHIYYKYLPERKLPLHEVEALHLLHNAYKAEDGNSFVDGIFYEMINDWEHIL